MKQRHRDALLNLALVVVSAGAVVTTSMAAMRAISGPRLPASLPTRDVPNWRTFSEGGHRLGPANAPVSIVEFSDFQCPYCRNLAAVLKTLRSRYGTQLALIYRHFPLDGVHSLARPAAIASECAARQDRFEMYHDVIFAEQPLRADNWANLAVRAGVPDTIAFNECLTDPLAEARVDADVAAGMKLDVRWTPTILVNQSRLTEGATERLLDSLIRAMLPRPQ